jgi:hypothetical protein
VVLQAPDGLPLNVKFTASPATALPFASTTVTVTVDCELDFPSAGTLPGLAVIVTPACCPKNPKRSTTRSVEPLKLKKETLPVELNVASVKLGIVWPATQFKSDDSGLVPPPG